MYFLCFERFPELFLDEVLLLLVNTDYVPVILQVIKTPNAETPLASGAGTPLLTMDVWEHAYYLDVQNRRPDYIKTFLGELVNWDFVAEHYSSP